MRRAELPSELFQDPRVHRGWIRHSQALGAKDSCHVHGPHSALRAEARGRPAGMVGRLYPGGWGLPACPAARATGHKDASTPPLALVWQGLVFHMVCRVAKASRKEKLMPGPTNT